MSHTLLRMQRDGGTPPFIHSEGLDGYVARDRLPTPQEQADDLILWIGDHQSASHLPAQAPELFLDAWIGAELPVAPGTSSGLRWLVQALDDQKLFRPSFQGGNALFVLTMLGWARYAELKKGNQSSRTAFMAMKFGDPDLNHVVDTCFRPAVKRTEFELRVLTDNQPAGIIDDQMRAAILASRFVIADLTHGSYGAYWEAGFAEGLGLPVIYTCRDTAWQAQQTHFDTNHLVTIIWNMAELKKAGDILTATIRATLRAEAKQTDG